MATTIRRLEQALQLWERHFYGINCVSRLETMFGQTPNVPIFGPVEHWKRLRAYLLRSMDDEFGVELFNTERIPEVEKHTVVFLQMLPWALALWTRNSRRVYHLNAEIQKLILLTSLEGVAWGSVPLPFDSFAVTFEVPIIDSYGYEYDSIIFNKSESGHLDFYAFCTSLERVQPVSDFTFTQIERAISARRIANVVHRLKEIDKDINGAVIGNVIHIGSTDPKLENVFIADIDAGSHIHVVDSKPDDKDSKRKNAITDTVFLSRLVAGLCLYLRTVPSGSPHVSSWTKQPASKGNELTTDITREADVCLVTSMYTLDHDEHALLANVRRFDAKSFHELSAHFREGHWRRPPGHGHDPNAVKTVHVRPTIVRADRRVAGTLIGGMQKSL